ncbi:hypothetical protein AAFG07_17720 [Bradyrhizobium sp. B097]|uniref:hypothetical protein n=1 Tax=Bradyrhizobium sp. B097 TaxID=3140244 RepID=UPI0031844AE0
MTQLKIVGAVALVAAALASPVMAQQTIGTPARCSNATPDARCQAMAPGTTRTTYHHRSDRRDRDWQGSYNRVDPGPFGPVDAAAGVVGGVVGGAVGTAAAIATAPIGGAEYARQNGFICTPGTWFRGSDGLRHPCQ